MPRLFSSNAGVLAVESFFIFAAIVIEDTVIAVSPAVNDLGGGNGRSRIASISRRIMAGPTTGIVSGSTADAGGKPPCLLPSA